MPNSNTFNILQDKNNFIWVSTIGGLVRYDGYNIKNYDASFFNINEGSTLHLALEGKTRKTNSKSPQRIIGIFWNLEFGI